MGGEGGQTFSRWDGGDWKVKREIVVPCPLLGHSWIHCWSSSGVHSDVRDMQMCLGQLISTVRIGLRENLPFPTDPAKFLVTLIAWSDLYFSAALRPVPLCLCLCPLTSGSHMARSCALLRTAAMTTPPWTWPVTASRKCRRRSRA